MIKFVLKKLGILPKQRKKLKNPSNQPYYLLRLEGLMVFVLATFFYFFQFDFSLFRLLLFAVLMVFPDVTLIGYAFGLRFGGTLYNLAHTYIFPAIVLGVGMYFGIQLIVDVALGWFAHLAQDRMRGYGFKYLNKYEGTHLHNI